MDINLLTLFAPGKMAGAEKVVSTGYNAMAGQKHYLGLIEEDSAPQFAKEFSDTIENPEQIQFLRSSSPLDLKLIIKLRQLIERKNIQIIHSHGYKALIYAFISKLITRRKLQLVHTHHGNTGHTRKVIFNEGLALLIMKLCDQVVSLSPVMTRWLQCHGVKKTTEITNMLSLPAQAMAEAVNRPNQRAKRIYLYLGRLSPEKNPETLLYAFSKVSESHHEMELHVVGDGMLLQQCQKKYESFKNIYFHGHQEKILEFIEQADYLCLPSLSEGMPMTVIEALCLGTPIIANKVGALEYMCNPENAYLIDIGPPHVKEVDFSLMNKKWYDVLEESLNVDKKSYTMAHKQDERLKYSIENWVEKTLTLYQGLLKK